MTPWNPVEGASLRAAILPLNGYMEARGEPDDGLAGVLQVTVNRTRLRYASDGTLFGTVVHHAAFSWTEYRDGPDGYERIAYDPAQQLVHMEKCLAVAQADKAQWARCQRIAAEVDAGKYHSPLFDRLGSEAVLYYAPDACATPAWARPLAFIIQLGHQRFYRDISRGVTSGIQVAENYGAAGTAAALKA